MKITNKTNLSLALVVLLCHDDYDGHNPDPFAISATTLLKPVRSIVLAIQNQKLDKEVDVIDLIPSVFGSSVHAFAEKAWMTNDTLMKAFKIMGLDDSVIDRVIINPKLEDLKEDSIAIYIERRTDKKVGKWTISGKFDLCIYGKLADYKSTSVWAHIFDSNASDYSLQGSIYKWLNPDLVSADDISIEKMFTDWSASKARYDKKYPKLRVLSKDYPLMPLPEIDNWIRDRLYQIESNLDKKQAELPVCNNDELWASDDKWKYYKKPNAVKATKIYASAAEAQTRLTSEGCGEVRHFPGEVRRCTYCSVVEICDQAKGFIADGRLKI